MLVLPLSLRRRLEEGALNISLVVTSFDRQADLDRLALSIFKQTFRGKIEVSFVSQGSAKFRLPESAATHVEVIENSLAGLTPLSRARNLGMKEISGDIIGFPDDDCWYEPDLLEKIATYFRNNPEIDCICTSVYDPDRMRSYGKCPVDIRRRMSFTNVVRFGSSVGIFVRREALELAGAHFDERLGAGTPFGSGEETELLGRLLAHRLRIEYLGDLQVYHPVPDYSNTDIRKYYLYGMGFGYLIARFLRGGHPGVLLSFLNILARSLGGAIVKFYDPILRELYLMRFVGTLKGFVRGNAAAKW